MFGINDGYARNDIVKSWGQNISSGENENTFSRYRSIFEYNTDFLLTGFPISTNHQYSSIDKSFYSVVAQNIQTNQWFPSTGYLDIERLGQTDVLDVICYSDRLETNMFGAVSLKGVIQPLIYKMGIVHDAITKENVGTCTLIAENLVIMARHAVEERNIQDLEVKFGFVKIGKSFGFAGSTDFEYIVEEDDQCDYAILKLKKPLGKEFGYVELNFKDEFVSDPALLHYPLGKPLKVSVHAFDQPDYQTLYLRTFHDTDHFSSGGAYFDQLGRFTAMHLGTQLEQDKISLSRYAIPLKEIVQRNPYSILGKFAKKTLDQKQSYRSSSPKYHLNRSSRNFFLLDKEGYQSEKILRNLLQKYLQTDKKIDLTKKKTIFFQRKIWSI